MGNRHYFHLDRHPCTVPEIESTTLDEIGFDGEPIHPLALANHDAWQAETAHMRWASPSERAMAKARALLDRYAHIKDGWGR